MRQQHRIGGRHQQRVDLRFTLEDIQPCPADLPCGQGFGQRHFIDDITAGSVDHNPMSRHSGDRITRHDMAGFITAGAMQADNICRRAYLFDCWQLRGIHIITIGYLRAVVKNHVHAKPMGATAGHGLADTPHANNADRFA